MAVRVGINGFGRIGRNYLRVALDRGIDVVALNDVADPRTLAHLLKYDSTYGPLERTVDHDDRSMTIGGKVIDVFSTRQPAELPWAEMGVDIVIEATGRFRARDDAAEHLKAGARKVLISAPGKDADFTAVIGVNEGDYNPDLHDVISNASCTTNCVVPMVKVLHDAFGVATGFMTTIHGYTSDQMLLDGLHKDLRRARSAGVNIVPTSTGAARSIGLIIPELAGRIDGIAVRVPVEDGSLTDLVAVLNNPATRDEVNDAYVAAAEAGPLCEVLDVTSDPIVSRDVVGNPASCVFDSGLTEANGTLVKVFGWYDNEWGYSHRLADLTDYVGVRL
ncbi:MAG TPA: type I glyceraldehyde-3-phosphate dehydrogenase [Jiangellaceae bacterium]|nr:type I glyceraldehyde-3-phosphate dehydrogenase [Jiangellaceae bacterium]